MFCPVQQGLEIGLELGHDGLRVRDELPVGDQAQPDLVGVAEDADPHTQVSRLGNPEHERVEGRASEVDLLFRPHDVGQNQRSFEAKDGHTHILDRLGHAAQGGQDGKGDRCFEGVLETAHAPPQFFEAFLGVSDAEGQGQEDKSELVAQILLGAGAA